MARPSRILSLSAVLLAAALAVTGCKKSEGGKAELPPASGEGAPPLPDVPDVRPAGDGAGTAAGPAEASDTRTTGTLVARQQVAVAPKGSGTIVALEVDEGSRVKKGDVLFRLDSRDAQLMKKAAETQLRGAKLQLKTAQTEYDRVAKLVAQNAAARQQLDQLDAQVEGAKVAIAAAQNSLAMAQKAIGDATVRAPIDGIVIQKLMSAGEYATMMPPSPVVVLQDQATLELKFRLPERSLIHVQPGKQGTAKVMIPALGIAREVPIKEVAPMVDPRTRTVEYTAVLDNADGALRPGLMAEVTIGGGS